jgi:hypothetical protein
MTTTITPFNHLREMLRTHSIPLRIAVVRMLLDEIIASSMMTDRNRLTGMLVKLLDDIAEDHT